MVKPPCVGNLCVQGCAAVRKHCKPTMRLDIGIPTTVEEAEMGA